jgi:hypothetical protein
MEAGTQPVDIPLTYDPKTQTLYCPHCDETIEIRRDVARDPERLLSIKEMVAIDHAECASYNDIRAAKLARKWRKGWKRNKLLLPRPALA